MSATTACTYEEESGPLWGAHIPSGAGACLGGVYTKSVSVNYVALTAGINQYEQAIRARRDNPFSSSRVRRLGRYFVLTDATNREVGAVTQVPARVSAVCTPKV